MGITRARSWLLAVAFLGAAELARPDATPTTTLLLALDGVGFVHVRRACEAGLLSQFRPPVPVVSPFPTLTGVGFTGMMVPIGYPPAPGYENRHFSWKHNKVVGGIPYIPFPWHDYFELQQKSLWRKTIGYLYPGRVVKSDLRWTLEQVLESPETFFTAYLVNSDPLAHMQGSDGVFSFLADLDSQLTAFRVRYRKERGRELRVAIFSDHGQTLQKVRPIHDLKDTLAACGFELAGSIQDDHTVVIARFGYVEAGMLFSRDNVKSRVARCVAQQIEGIELTAYAENGAVVVVSGMGEARVEALAPSEGVDSRRGLKLRYRPVLGDPLLHTPIEQILRNSGRTDADGYGAAQDWLEASITSEFPDALYRLNRAFYGDDIENLASVIFVTKPGRAYGHPITRGLSWLRGGKLDSTHGGLGLQASLAVLLTDDAELPLPAVLRYDQLLPMLERYRHEPEAAVTPPPGAGP